MGPDPYFATKCQTAFAPCRNRSPTSCINGYAVIASALLPLAGDSPATQAYALGFLSHFLLEPNAHPYIEAVSGKAHTPSDIKDP